MTLINDKIFQMRVSEEFLHRIEEWRKSHAVIPSRSDAIRQLVDRGLAPSAPAAAAAASVLSLPPPSGDSLAHEFDERRLQENLAGVRLDELVNMNVRISSRLKRTIDWLIEDQALRVLVQEMLIEGVNQRLCARGMKPQTF